MNYRVSIAISTDTENDMSTQVSQGARGELCHF